MLQQVAEAGQQAAQAAAYELAPALPLAGGSGPFAGPTGAIAPEGAPAPGVWGGHGGKAEKRLRAQVFADWLVEQYGVPALQQGTGQTCHSRRGAPSLCSCSVLTCGRCLSLSSGVLDVAGGKGALSFALHCERGVSCTLIDPGRRKRHGLSKRQVRALEKKKKVDGQQAQLTVDGQQQAAGTGAVIAKAAAESQSGGAGVSPGREEESESPDPKRRRGRGAELARADCFAIREVCFDKEWVDGPDGGPLLRDASVVVGMHTDEATEALVDLALQFGRRSPPHTPTPTPTPTHLHTPRASCPASAL